MNSTDSQHLYLTDEKVMTRVSVGDHNRESINIKTLPAGIVDDLSALFKVLGDPTRIKILHALSHSELCVCDLVALLSMLDSAVSHQLRVLRAHKLVSNRRQGRNICYTLADNHVRTLFAQGLEHVTEGDQHD